MTGQPDGRDLVTAWENLAESARPTDDCPPPERIWHAVRGDLSPAETRTVIGHTAVCASCAEAWRLARSMEPPAEAAPAAPGRGRQRWAAAAAALLLAAGLSWQLLDRGPGPIERGEPPEIESLVPEGASLPRRAFLLEWSPGPEGARYDLLVTTPELEVVVRWRRLEEPRYRVPAAKLRGLGDGAELLWRVEMVLPDGRHVASPAFRVRVG